MATAQTELVEDWSKARPAIRARARWLLSARPEQMTPGGDWNVWLFQAGRGAGKSRAAAEDMAYHGLTHPKARMAIVAPTYADARDTCVEGESGMLACLPPEDVKLWNRSLGELVLKNGARYKLFSSEEPDRLRGPQHERVWCDELATFRDVDTWDMLQMGLRLGKRPQTIVSTTPRSVKLIRELLRRDDVVVTRGTTWDNAENLAPAALTALRERYAGTRLGRQELEGLLLEDVEGALWRREWIESARVHEIPYPGARKSVVGLDPSDGYSDSDEQGMVLASLAWNHRFYVREARGDRETPLAWLKSAVLLAQREDAVIVVEKNHGGQFLVGQLEQAMRDLGVTVPYQVVSASQGKMTRAEPVAMLYEQGKVSHVGQHEVLEEQMVTMTGAPGEKSPDRLDALVWALTELMGYGRPIGLDQAVAVPYTDRPVAGGAVAWR